MILLSIDVFGGHINQLPIIDAVCIAGIGAVDCRNFCHRFLLRTFAGADRRDRSRPFSRDGYVGQVAETIL